VVQEPESQVAQAEARERHEKVRQVIQGTAPLNTLLVALLPFLPRLLLNLLQLQLQLNLLALLRPQAPPAPSPW